MPNLTCRLLPVFVSYATHWVFNPARLLAPRLKLADDADQAGVVLQYFQCVKRCNGVHGNSYAILLKNTSLFELEEHSCRAPLTGFH